MKPLVILESPHKCISVRKYTKNECDAAATAGHIMDLPQNSLAIEEDAEGKIDFASIKFVPLEGKERTIKQIKEAASGRDVFLATDPDREGESIAYDVYGQIKRVAKHISRIEIHQITEKGVNDALRKPRQINQLTVAAQRSRRFIDRLVGYKLTRYAAEALGTEKWAEASVGRTQSAALKMVYDRDKEIENFIPEPFWKVLLTDKDDTVFSSRIFKGDTAETEAAQLMDAIKRTGAYIQDIDRKQQLENSPKPLTASTLQQKANKKYGYAPKKTMQIAQELYQDGHITYMRTDSVRLAPETQALANKYLKDCFAEVAPDKPPVHMNKSGNTQDAHEAIHPTEINKEGHPDVVNQSLNPDQRNLYKLIWDYFYASQAKAASWDTCKVTVASKGSKETLTASGKTILDPGWRSFLGMDAEQYPAKTGEEQEQENKKIFNYKTGAGVSGELSTKKDFTKAPPYYTMATFLTALEKNSIGRPATWATICETILNRNYVSETGKLLKHTPKGDSMVMWLMEICPQIASVKFTSLMEDQLQAIEEGKETQENVVNLINGVLNESIAKAKLIPKGKYHVAGVDYSNKDTGYYQKAASSKSSSFSGYKKTGYGKSSSKGYSKNSYSKSRYSKKSSGSTQKKYGGGIER